MTTVEDHTAFAAALSEIRNSLIGHWYRRCDAVPSDGGFTIQVYRGDRLEFSYRIELVRHPQHGYETVQVTTSSPSHIAEPELLLHGMHVANLKARLLQDHFFFCYGRSVRTL